MATVETGAIIYTGLKAGGLAAGIAMLSGDMEFQMILVVGLFGGLIFAFREYVHLEVKTTKLKAISDLLFTVPVSISTAGIVYYIGINVINQYIQFGNILWIFVSLLASLHYRTVIKFFGTTVNKIVNNKYGKDN